MQNKVMIISVHPDDETLGCGGTILKHLAQNDKVYCVYVTEGNEHQAKVLPQLNSRFGFTGTNSLKFPEILLDDISLSAIIPKIANSIREIEPTIVYIPNRSDPHSDHRRVFDACQACIKSFRFPFIKKVMMCEVQSETDFAPALAENAFLPTVFVDITDYFDKKMAIMKLFESELLDSPFTRSFDSIRAQHRYRGSQINVQYAESFMLLKEVL